MTVTLVAVAAAGIALAGFTAYQAAFLLLGLAAGRSGSLPKGLSFTRFAVIIPAHNEAALIGGTVTSVLESAYPAERREVFVIADNCTDDTARRARLAGATCCERYDEALRGKPHALNWMISQLDFERYDAVVIVDADTVVDGKFLQAMDAHLAAGEEAIQGYFGVLNPDENWLTRLSVLPASVKFRLHFPGKRVVGLSCPLAGNGMCFSAAIMRRFGWKVFSITENWEYYVMLVLNGYVTTAAAEAVVYSQVARSLKLGETQRMRWMKGQLDTLRRYWRLLLKKGLRNRSLVELDALLELLRPSHANLLFSTLLYVAVCAVLLSAGVAARPWLLAGSAMVGLQVLYFLLGFAMERPPFRTWLALAMVPWYLLWKCFVSLKGFLSLSEQSWVKTTRN